MRREGGRQGAGMHGAGTCQPCTLYGEVGPPCGQSCLHLPGVEEVPPGAEVGAKPDGRTIYSPLWYPLSI